VNKEQQYSSELYMGLMRLRQERKAFSEIGSNNILFTLGNKQKHTIDVEVVERTAKGIIKGSINEMTKPVGNNNSHLVSKEVVKIIAKSVYGVPYEDLFTAKNL
jgi:hypothetical protein